MRTAMASPLKRGASGVGIRVARGYRAGRIGVSWRAMRGRADSREEGPTCV